MFAGELNPKFIEYTSHKGFWVAYEWLKAHNTPQEILDLLEDSQFILSRAPELRAGTLDNETMDQSILPDTQDIINLVYKVGGSFATGLDYDLWAFPNTQYEGHQP